MLQYYAHCIYFIANYCNMNTPAIVKAHDTLSRITLLLQKNTRVTQKEANPEKYLTKEENRKSVSIFFFMHGLCFATWASRIPTIQTELNLSAAALGTILFSLPLGFFISLGFAGWLIAKAGSRMTVIISSVLYSISLVSIGFSDSPGGVAVSLLLFGFFANLLNISINTQAVAVEDLYKKRLMATFHGLWSLAGFTGAALGALMIGKNVSPLLHFIVISMIFLIAAAIYASKLVQKDKTTREKGSFFTLPDKALLGLGAIAFCSMMVEGAMFDWSGIYFIQEVHADSKLTGLGYTTFMVAMAAMRFLADGIAGRFGLKRILQVSGLLATIGLLIAVILPQLLTSVLGFLLVGMGVSAVVPMVYSAAGRSKTMAAGRAITAVSSLGFMGFLIGPPTIGLIAEAFTLRGSFLALTVMAVAVVIFSSRLGQEHR